MLRRIFIIYLLICLTPFLANAALSHLSGPQISYARKAIDYARKNQLTHAHAQAAFVKDPHLNKLLAWLSYQNGGQPDDFETIIRFIKNNPSWPHLPQITTLAEYTLPANTESQNLIHYFANYEPKTLYGKQLYAKALLSLGMKTETARILVKDVWIHADFSKNSEREFLNKYRRHLSKQDYVARIDRLLWENKVNEAKRLIAYVDKNYQLTFQARIALMQDHYSAGSMVGRMPKNMLNDPGFLYARVNWHHRRKNFDNVQYYLKAAPQKLTSYQDKWWGIKNRLIRELIQKRQYKNAYYFARTHYNPKGTEGYAEAEWLAGWLALQFLRDAKTGYSHFYDMYQNVSYPISKSRAAYWAGRAAEKNKNFKISDNWYTVASSYPSSYYGQLAHVKHYPGMAKPFEDIPVPNAKDIQLFKKNELAIIAKILLDTEHFALAEKFMNAGVTNAPTNGVATLISQLGLQAKRLSLSVIASKEALKKNLFLARTGFPVLESLPKSLVGSPVILGIIRQESRFDYQARSPADALGLMQILPSTARKVAHDLRIRYTPARITQLLTQDPAFNVRLGSTYIDQLFKHTDQSYIIAIASYNAGLSNVRRWVSENGDPRDIRALENAVDWVELIPFSETRNYVQRVLENKQVYQYLIEKKPFSLDKDLLATSRKR